MLHALAHLGVAITCVVSLDLGAQDQGRAWPACLCVYNELYTHFVSVCVVYYGCVFALDSARLV